MWLQRVLKVNPSNETAKATLDRMAYKTAARENRILVIFGAVAAVLIIVAIVLIIAIGSGGH
jgi:t-SNARE complex subunit (syntaxin)